MKPLWLQTPVQLSNHLRSFRRARGLTQAALGELIGLDQTRIAKIERDPRLVSVGQLLKLLAVLHVRVLLEPATPKPPSSVGERRAASASERRAQGLESHRCHAADRERSRADAARCDPCHPAGPR